MTPPDPDVVNAYTEWAHSKLAHPPIVALMATIAESGAPWHTPFMLHILDHQGPRTSVQNNALRKSLLLLDRAWAPLWYTQGCPDELASMQLHVEALPPTGQIAVVALGLAMDRAITRGRAPRDLITSVQALLPSRYLECRGWENLTDVPDVLFRALVMRSGSVNDFEVPKEFQRIARYLHGNLERSWSHALVFAAASLIGEKDRRGERNSPLTITTYLKFTSGVLNGIFGSQRFGPSSTMKFSDIENYLDDPTLTSKRSTRIAYLHGYLAVREAQIRFVSSFGEAYRGWCLPDLPQNFNFYSHDKFMAVDRQKRRSERVNAVAPQYLKMLQVIVKRAYIFQNIRRCYLDAKAEFLKSGESPVFSILLPDRSAELVFRILDLEYGCFHYRGRQVPRRPWPSLKGKFLTELVEVRSYGEGARERTFFEDIYLFSHSSADADLSVIKPIRKGDRVSPAPGLFLPEARVGRFCHDQNRVSMSLKNQAPLLLDLDALCAGVALGSLLIILSYALPLRLHEIQQIRRESDFTYESAMDTLITTVFPKSQKRDKKMPSVHQIHPYVLPFWMEFISIIESTEFGTKKVKIENSAEFDLENGYYLFQWRGRSLSQTSLNRLIRYSTHGIFPNNEAGDSQSLTAHLFRHLYSRIAIEWGRSKMDIQESLGHYSSFSTLTYLDGVSAEVFEHPSGLMTDWEALIVQRSNVREGIG